MKKSFKVFLAEKWWDSEPEWPETVKPESWMLLGEEKGEVIKVESKKAKKYLEWTRKAPEWKYLWKRGRKQKLGYKPKVVLVFGPSGSGKDVVTEVIEENLGEKIVHLSADWYYGPLGKIGKKKIYSSSYDQVNAVDWELLKYQIKALKEGFEVKAPVYDFSTHFRRLGKAVKIKPKPIILVSGIMVAEALKLQADLIIGVEATWEVCVERRISRDVSERGRTREQCEAQIKATVKEGYEQFVKPYFKIFREKKWQKKVVLVDNFKNARSPMEPARINKDIYLDPIKKLLKN